MGVCSSSVENDNLPDQEHTDDQCEKKEKEPDIISHRTISVRPAESAENSARAVDQRSHKKTQHDVHVAPTSALVEKTDTLPQPPNTLHVDQAKTKEPNLEDLNTSASEKYVGGAQARHSQIHHIKDGGQVRYRNEDAGTIDLKQQIQELRHERDTMAEINMDITKDKARLEKALVQSRLEIDDLRTRLSRVASERLTDNNPNIADLSDQNRPVKIADRYSEIYTNEWSDAYEDLVASGSRSEQEAIQILLEFIKNIYEICLDASMKHLIDLNTNILLFTGHIVSGNDMQLSSNLSSALKPFKDERKLMYKAFLSTLHVETNAVRDIKLVKKEDKTKRLQKYLDIATELCWLMCIQDPPVHLYTDCKQGTAFDEVNFTAFTVRGTTVDYLVWPALHLHHNGPILQKGVAQGKATKQQKRTENSSEDVIQYSGRNTLSQHHDQNAQSTLLF